MTVLMCARVNKSELFSCKQERFLTFDPCIIILKACFVSNPAQVLFPVSGPRLLGKGLFKIMDQILDILNSHADSDHIIINRRILLLLLCAVGT